jgi:hypothetical protein
MNSHLKLFSSLIVYLFLILSFSCSKQTTKWQGTIEIIDGITVVENPKEPMYSKDVFELKEDLVIRNEEGTEEFLFYNILFLDVDKEENIYISDTKAAHIKVFNKSGDFLSTISRRGQGPEELISPREIQIFPQGELMVNDDGQSRIKFFSLNGKYLRQFSIGRLSNWREPKVDSQGNMVAGYLIFEDAPQLKSGLKKFAPDLSPIFTIVTQPLVWEAGGITDFFEHKWTTNLAWDITAKDDIIWGVMNNYEIFVHNPEGELTKKIVRENDMVKITKEDEEKLMRDHFGDNPPPSITNYVIFPTCYPEFIRFTCDEEGRIFVQNFEQSQDGESYYDVFDSEGKFIITIALKYRPQVWKNGKMYSIEEDSYGVQIVKRYKVTWTI